MEGMSYIHLNLHLLANSTAMVTQHAICVCYLVDKEFEELEHHTTNAL